MHVCKKARRSEAQVSHIMGIPRAIGAAGELSWHAALQHKNIPHAKTRAGNTKRITAAAEIPAKHALHSSTF